MPASSLFSKALPDLGDETDLSIAAERRLGDSIVRSLYRDPDYLDDPVLTDYVQSIWQPLLRSARARGDLRADMQEVFAWEILVSKERDVNAFALPGGYFGLYLGLVGMVQTRDELASVLGHEMSHVTQRHIARRMSKESAQTPWMIGGMILGLLAASKSNNYNAANAAIMGSQAIAIQNGLNYSRDMEREADRTGFGVATEAGFEAQGFVAMFEKLQQASRNNDSGGFPYLRSHPLTTERIADMQGRIGMQPAAPLPADADWQALLMAARARPSAALANLRPLAMAPLAAYLCGLACRQCARWSAGGCAGRENHRCRYCGWLAAIFRTWRQSPVLQTPLRSPLQSRYGPPRAPYRANNSGHSEWQWLGCP